METIGRKGLEFRELPHVLGDLSGLEEVSVPAAVPSFCVNVEFCLMQWVFV